MPTDRPTTTELCLPYTPATPAGQLYLSAVGMAVIIAELLALYFDLDLRAVGAAGLARLEHSLRWWRLGSTPSCRGWDGVALKQAVDARLSAPWMRRSGTLRQC